MRAPRRACPASWYATVFILFYENLAVPFLSNPSWIRSRASTMSLVWIDVFSFLAQKIAASLRRFYKSAPDMPMHLLAISLKSTLSAIVLPLEWTFKIYSLPSRSGNWTWTCLSNLPGLIRALSRISGILVAAITTTPVLSLKPSISVRSWLMVYSISSFLIWPPPLLCLPIVSSSSMNMMLGAVALAWVKSSLILLAPTPK